MMSIMSAMFSAKGRLAPADFQQAGLILVGVSFVLALAPVVLPFGLTMLLGFLSLILIYPWVCLWSKRLHDAGQSGWLAAAAIVVWIILNYIMGQIVSTLFAPDAAQMMLAAQETGNPQAILQATQEMTRMSAIPSAIGGLIVGAGMVFGGSRLLKSDPEENRYGPPTGGEASEPAETE